jgi:hypothetical protein
MSGEQNEAMKPQVGHLGSDPRAIAILRRHHRFGGLLADLLQDRVVAFREQRRDVRRRRIGALRNSIAAARRSRTDDASLPPERAQSCP